MRRRIEPAPEPTPRRFPLAGWLVALGALLLPILGAGMPLGEHPTPGVASGQAILLVIFSLALLTAPPATGRARSFTWLAALAALGLLSLLITRSGGQTTPTGLFAGEQPYALRLPADREAGLRELCRLTLLLVMLCAAARVKVGFTLGGLATGGAVSGLRGLREYLLAARAGDPNWRIFAGFDNPNQLASYLLLAIAATLLLAALCREGSSPVRWLAAQQVERPALKLRLMGLAAAGLLVLCLAFSGSRGGLLGLFAMLVAIGVALALRWGKRALGLLLCGALLVLALGFVAPVRHRLVSLAAQSSSMRFRALTWAGTIDLAEHYPLLGVGLGGWPQIYPVYARGSFTQHAHSGYLQTWADLGVPGLLVYLGLFGSWLLLGNRLRRQSGAAADVGVGLLAATIGFGLHNAVDFGWGSTAVAGSLVLLGAAASRYVPSDGPARTARGSLLPALLALLVLLAVGSAESQRVEGRRLLQTGQAAAAMSCYRQALKTTSWSGQAAEDLAGALTALGRAHEAEAAYRAALRRRPDSSRLTYRLAQLLAESGQLSEALPLSARAVSLSPLHLQGYLQLGRLLEQADRPAEARRVYERLDQIATRPELTEAAPIQGYVFEPTHAYGLMRLGELALAVGDEASARDAFTRALPQFEEYLETFAREEDLVKELPAEQRLALLLGRGLDEAEREQVKQLVARAEAVLGSAEPSD